MVLGVNKHRKMAPLLQRSPHGFSDPTKYSLRTTKHPKHIYSEFCDFNTWGINAGKENFFRLIGLQMKRVQCEYGSADKQRKSIKINIPRDVQLKECSVVIPKDLCMVCGRSFMCKANVNLHTQCRHGMYIRARSDERNEINLTDCSPKRCKLSPERVKYSTNVKTPVRLTLKIGREIVTRIQVQRKYLKHRTKDSNSLEEIRSATEKDNYESDVAGIDSPVYSSNPTSCDVPSICSNKAMNIDGDIESRELAKHQLAREEKEVDTVKNTQTVDLDRSIVQTTDSGDRRIIASDDIQSNKLSTLPEVVVIDVEENTSEENTIRNSISNEHSNANVLPTGHANSLTVENGTPDEPKATSLPENNISHPDANTIRVKPRVQNIDVVSKPTERSHAERNEAKRKRPRSSPKKQLAKHTQEQHTEPPIVVGKDSVDDVQVILRINRGKKDNSDMDINHESPTRLEREILVMDAIKDMLRMEEQGYHLLAEKKHISPKRKKATCTDSITKTDNSVHSKSAMEENRLSNTKNSPTKLQKLDSTKNPPCTLDSLKENVAAFNDKFNISLEELNRYGIKCYNDTLEINNNVENIEEPAHIRLPYSANTEITHQRPSIIIDLIDDSD